MLTTHLHIEASSYCNARCPGCPRNGYGYPIAGRFKQQHLDLEKYSEILGLYPDVKTITFSGNHGDPVMHPDIVKLCEPTNIKYDIATNGSIGLLESYVSLAKLGVEVTFGIDGLEDTNHLYRQGVIWNNLMNRVKKFIDAGGTAIWQFIKFQHNMDQIDEAKNYSEKLGFKTINTPIKPKAIANHLLIPMNSFKKNFAKIDTKKGQEKNKALAVANCI